MDKFEIQKLRDLPIEGVAERLGLKVSRHKALCPFHNDSNPSLSFRVSTNTFRCFVCGAHGGVIDLAMQVLRSGFSETCQHLSNKHNIILDANMKFANSQIREKNTYPPDVDYLSRLVSHPVLNEPARHFLFDERKLNPKVIEWCGISSINYPTPCWRYGKPFYDAPSLLIPYKDINGKVLNVQSRYLGEQLCASGPTPRFRFPANSSIHIFNLPILKYLKEGEPLFISEGITDCLALLSAGHKAIAIPSATLLKPEDVATITQHLPPDSQLHMYPDADEPGEQLYLQLKALLSSPPCASGSLSTGEGGGRGHLIRHSLPHNCKDFSDYYLLRHQPSDISL